MPTKEEIKEWFNILNLNAGVYSKEYIESYYRIKLAPKFHPDKNPDNPEAEKNFKRVTAAKDKLIKLIEQEPRRLEEFLQPITYTELTELTELKDKTLFAVFRIQTNEIIGVKSTGGTFSIDIDEYREATIDDKWIKDSFKKQLDHVHLFLNPQEAVSYLSIKDPKKHSLPFNTGGPEFAFIIAPIRLTDQAQIKDFFSTSGDNKHYVFKPSKGEVRPFDFEHPLHFGFSEDYSLGHLKYICQEYKEHLLEQILNYGGGLSSANNVLVMNTEKEVEQVINSLKSTKKHDSLICKYEILINLLKILASSEDTNNTIKSFAEFKTHFNQNKEVLSKHRNLLSSLFASTNSAGAGFVNRIELLLPRIESAFLVLESKDKNANILLISYK